jgi:hypothetical protein
MRTPAFDPRQYKALQRHEWGVSAAGWQQHWALWERAAQHVNVRLIELAHVDAGHRVLDLATGLGEPAFTAARRVGPTGWVVATDAHMAKTSFTSVGSLADSPAPLLRPSPATGYAAEILDVDDPDLGYDADPCP